jgi:hypothetical protein
MRKGFTALMDLRERRMAFQTVLDRDGARLPDARRMSSLVHRALARQALWDAGREYYREGPGQTSVDELLAFAFDCWPEVCRLPLYRTLQAGKRIGPQGMLYMVNHKGHWWLRRRGWKFRGY